MTTDTMDDALDRLMKRLDTARPFNIGSPGALDFPMPPEIILRLLWHLLNNVGDLRHFGIYPNHTKHFEAEVIDFLARLFGAPDGYWGHITPSGTDSNLNALRIARAHLSTRTTWAPVAMHFSSAHDSVPMALETLGIPPIHIKVDPLTDYHDLNDFRDQVWRYRDRPIIVVATIGTTMTEAVDDVAAIAAILREAMVPYWIHADAALSGIPLALDPRLGEAPFGFSSGADSISTSGHKFPGVPLVCSALIVRNGRQAAATRHLGYTGTDTVLHTSRSGHAPLLWWYANRYWGLDGYRRRALVARTLAHDTHTRLMSEAGAISWLHNSPSFTVVANSRLPQAITEKWYLAPGERTRVYTMPGVTPDQIDRFIEDVRRCLAGSAPATT